MTYLDNLSFNTGLNQNISLLVISSLFRKLNIINHLKFIKNLMNYVFDVKGTLFNTKAFFSSDDLFLINYKRRNFFPNISSNHGRVMVTTSLGLFSKMLNKGKSFIRSKMVYLITMSFFRKVLIYSSFRNLTLFIKNEPLYLNELLSTLFKPVVGFYKHPFNNYLVDEKLIKTAYKFNSILFINNKKFTIQKTRKRGRLKRRIIKRLISVNKVLD